MTAVGRVGPEAPLLRGAQAVGAHQPRHPVPPARLARPAQRHGQPRAAAGGRGGESPTLQVTPPRDEVGAGDEAELLRALDADESHEVGDVDLVGAAGARVVEVGEPFHFGQALKFPGCQCPRAGRRADLDDNGGILVGLVYG